MNEHDYSVRPIHGSDRPALPALVRQLWGDALVVAHGAIYRPAELPGFIAESEGEIVGLATYHLADGACELVTLDSLRPRRGIGTELLDAVFRTARGHGCTRVWLITTNDNLHALGFYQRQGFVLVALHRDAVTAARALKPSIPLVSADGIPIRDELVLELRLR